MADECCGNCRFFRLNTSLAHGVGACRRRPPVWTGPDEMNAEGMFAFPRVSQDNWCGEWEPTRGPAEIERLRLTASERVAVKWAAEMLEAGSLPRTLHQDSAAVLRELLDRTSDRLAPE